MSNVFQVTDHVKKKNTILTECRTSSAPRKLKIEINTNFTFSETEECIAWSKFSQLQVLTTSIRLDKMVQLKIDALLDRKEIRDAFDLEYLIRKGFSIIESQDKTQKLKKVINGFSKMDFKVKLGSILLPKERDYYNQSGFKFLLEHLTHL